MLSYFKKISCLLAITILVTQSLTGVSFAQINQEPEVMFNQATELFHNGEYKQAISIYDEILEIAPNNISTLKMKGIAQSNQGEHKKSLEQFFTVLQHRPNDVISLAGMGVGLGYLGEYQEATSYFEKALKEKPNSIVIQNYMQFINNVITKYPYIPTEKPEGLDGQSVASIPDWVKPIAKWWSTNSIDDAEFVSALIFMINNKIIEIPPVETQSVSEGKIPEWIKSNAGWWADGEIDDDAFVQGIQYMIEKGLIIIKVEETTQKTQEELDHEFYLFERYLRDISNNISKEKRYIEFPNPSQDVIKKFLRDYVKWNFEEEAKKASSKFPDPTYEIIDDTYIVYYKVYINEQPSGLPLDHVSTLNDSFAFWEQQELTVNNQKLKIKFEVTNLKHEANVWVTWVVRSLGEGVLGHAHLGKGIVEVALGDFNCDGSFQLYDVNSVETIMTHELGHSIGLKHVEDRTSIMYPSFNPSYAYCLLS
ncbi:M57 family metalloprotease [Nitrosopumilus sp.]|uniref:M57 family metalloprotease n=1 Tax=Nitrosopumilus sp. TaxID=2024843 RepID=UPI003D0E8FB3